MCEPARQTATEAYVATHSQLIDQLGQLTDWVENLPAPDDETTTPHWGHVGDLREVRRQLAEILAFVRR